MSDQDEEEVSYVKKQKTIHYGSLEEAERGRLDSEAAEIAGTKEETDTEKNNSNGMMVPSTATAGSKMEIESGGHINVSNEYLPIEEQMSKDKQLVLEEFERRKRARQIAVSTDDNEVRMNLRELGEAICLFGEGPADRRNRLKELLSLLGEDAVKKKAVADERERRFKQERDQETWYHEGPESLRIARLWISNFSLRNASQRLHKQKLDKLRPESVILAQKQELHRKVRSLSILGSQIGGTRPIAFCQFSPNSQMLATASWAGQCHLWSVPGCERKLAYKTHGCNASCVVFHPLATLSQPEDACCLASCATDGSVKLWSLTSDSPLADLEGHKPHRVSRLAFHPSGRFLGTCCFDNSWRLWDLEMDQEILHQEGHSKAVYSIAFQIDGSVAATGGADSFGRVWDLRTGRCIMFMEGHQKTILGVDFSPDGYQIATASEDNTCKIWDLRKRTSIYSIPAHNSLVSGVKFHPTTGQFLVTSSYDNTAKVWSAKTWEPLKELSGHDNKVMAVDVSFTGQYIATSSFDRTFKIWSSE